MEKNKKLGRRIMNKIFEGNPFKQLSTLWKNSIADDIILDAILSQQLAGYERIYNDEELDEAIQSKIKFRAFNLKIEKILGDQK